jgi:hypothetical protein
MHLPPKQDNAGSNPARIAYDTDGVEFILHERMFINAEFYMNIVQHMTTIGVLGYALWMVLKN